MTPFAEQVQQAAPQVTTVPTTVFDRFVARQPILDRAQHTVGYELLFRDSWVNFFRGDKDKDEAAHESVDNALFCGMEALAGTAIAFVNCTRELLLSRAPMLLPTGTVLELLEDIELDDHLVEVCAEYKKCGYRLAIDDFDGSPRWEVILHLVDYIKIELPTTLSGEFVYWLTRFKTMPVQLIAEKVETQNEFQAALAAGFHLFQGYFFERPVITARPVFSAVLNRFKFLTELSRSPLDYNKLTLMLKQEPAISLRMLRVANSAAMGTRQPMTNLRTALALIGDEQFRRIALLTIATAFAGNGAAEFLRFILQRARFCELLAPAVHMEEPELYLFGMLSAVGSTLGVPMRELSSTLFLRPEFLAGLEGTPNRYGLVLDLAQAFERGNWDEVAGASRRLFLTEEQIASAAHTAHAWTEEILTLS